MKEKREGRGSPRVCGEVQRDGVETKKKKKRNRE